MSPAPPGRLPVTWLPPGSTPGPFWSAPSGPPAPVLVLVHSTSPSRSPQSGASLSMIVACHTGALVSTQSGSDKLAEQADARVWPLAGLKTSRVPELVGTFGALRQKNFTTIEEASNRFHDHWSSADSSPAVALSRSVIQSHWCRAAASAPPFALRDTSAGGHALPPPCSTSLESIHAPASAWPDQRSPELKAVATFWPWLLAGSHMITVLPPP